MATGDERLVAQALFCSTLELAQIEDSAAVSSAVQSSLARFPEVHSLVGEFAQRYGEDPDRAAARMRWCLRVGREYKIRGATVSDSGSRLAVRSLQLLGFPA